MEGLRIMENKINSYISAVKGIGNHITDTYFQEFVLVGLVIGFLAATSIYLMDKDRFRNQSAIIIAITYVAYIVCTPFGVITLITLAYYLIAMIIIPITPIVILVLIIKFLIKIKL